MWFFWLTRSEERTDWFVKGTKSGGSGTEAWAGLEWEWVSFSYGTLSGYLSWEVSSLWGDHVAEVESHVLDSSGFVEVNVSGSSEPSFDHGLRCVDTVHSTYDPTRPHICEESASSNWWLCVCSCPFSWVSWGPDIIQHTRSHLEQDSGKSTMRDFLGSVRFGWWQAHGALSHNIIKIIYIMRVPLF